MKRNNKKRNSIFFVKAQSPLLLLNVVMIQALPYFTLITICIFNLVSVFCGVFFNFDFLLFGKVCLCFIEASYDRKFGEDLKLCNTLSL